MAGSRSSRGDHSVCLWMPATVRERKTFHADARSDGAQPAAPDALTSGVILMASRPTMVGTAVA
jgi:hypothetical protein